MDAGALRERALHGALGAPHGPDPGNADLLTIRRDRTASILNEGLATLAEETASRIASGQPLGARHSATGTFADPGADTWTATVDYGDGSGAQPLALAGKAFSLSHTYAAAGTYTVTVSVIDDEGAAGTRTATVTVITAGQAAANLQAQVNALAGTLGAGNAESRFSRDPLCDR